MKLLLFLSVHCLIACSGLGGNSQGYRAVAVPMSDLGIQTQLTLLDAHKLELQLKPNKRRTIFDENRLSEPPDEQYSHRYICGFVDDNGFVPDSYLDDKPHIKFRILGVREEWIPIEGKTERSLVFQVADAKQ